jgi:restriction endonuclease Mrr
VAASYPILSGGLGLDQTAQGAESHPGGPHARTLVAKLCCALLGFFDHDRLSIQTVMLPVLRLANGGEVRAADAVDRISDEFHLTPDERAELLPSGRQAKIANRVHWAVTYLVKAGLLSRPRRGVFAITERGREVLAKSPARIDISFLSQFDGFDQVRTKASDDIEGEPSAEPTANLPSARRTNASRPRSTI